MTTHPPSHDEIALPRFETRLWAELEREHQAQLDGDTPDEPVPLLLPLDPRRRSRRPRLRPLTIGVASAAAVAAVVVAVVAWPNDGSPDREAVTAGRDTAETTEPTTEPAQADLAQRIAAANTDGASDAIVHVRQDNATYGDDETWRDEATGHFRSLQHDEDGSPSYDSGAAAVPGEGGDQQTTRTVDYCFEQYTEGPETLPVGPGSATPWIRTGLEDGTLIVDGTQTVDGRELILLREVMPPDDPIEHGPDGTPRLEAEERTPANAPTTGTLRITTSTTATLPPDETAEREAEEAAAEQEAEEDAARRDAEEAAARREAEEAAARRDAEEDAAREAADEVMGWVLIDPETYRPVIVVGYPSGDEFTMTDAEYVQTYEYLPRTAENLAELVVPVPEGFAQVEDLRGDGERADAGCGP